MELIWSNFYDPLVDPLVLAGSSLSLVATFLVLLTFAVYWREQRTFRHALVLSLTVAEFLNSLNATLSASYFLATREFTPGLLCSANGWLGHVSVQAADFSMLAIAVFTLLTITEKVYMPAVSKVKKVLICTAIWVVPMTSACIALALGVMMPAGAHWCWISASRTDLRYALTHAWRFGILLAIICIYTYVYVYTSRHFKSLDRMEPPPGTAHACPGTADSHATSRSVPGKTPFDDLAPQAATTQLPHLAIEPPLSVLIAHDALEPPLSALLAGDGSWLRFSMGSDKDFPRPPPPALDKDTGALLPCHASPPPPPYAAVEHAVEPATPATPVTPAMPATLATPAAPLQRRPGFLPSWLGAVTKDESRRIEREVKTMLLMNAYPICYVLLSVPGLVSRLLQASSNPPSARVLDALQAASAFIGFASAVTYGFNRHVRQTIATDARNWKARGSTGVV